jgi:D-3-phosphoglycerate dehydrogenase
MIGAAEFAKMKDGVRIINCARGGIIDEEALYDALVSGKVAGAAVDVFAEEPPTDWKLLRLDNVVGSPHIGAATKEAQSRVGAEVAEKLIEFARKMQPA